MELLFLVGAVYWPRDVDLDFGSAIKEINGLTQDQIAAALESDRVEMEVAEGYLDFSADLDPPTYLEDKVKEDLRMAVELIRCPDGRGYAGSMVIGQYNVVLAGGQSSGDTVDELRLLDLIQAFESVSQALGLLK